MDDDFFRREYDLGPQKKDNLFLWTVCIILLAGVVLATWLGSFYIFGYPEVPRNYHILVKLHKLDPPKRFEYTAAPPGEFFNAQKIYEKYATMQDVELQQANTVLLRDYIRNYQSSGNPVPYITGQFTVISSRELQTGDIFPSGMVALAQCNDYPQVLLEYVYTADPDGVGYLKQTLAPGIQVTPDRTRELSAIIHIEKLPDGRLLLTAMPITYGSYTLKNGAGTFSLDPPPTMHLEGGVPITKLASIPPSGKNYGLRPVATGSAGENSPSSSPAVGQLVRVMAPLPVSTPRPGAHPSQPPIALGTNSTPPPQPVSTPPPVAIAVATPTPATFVQNVTPAPVMTPAPESTPDPGMATPAAITGTAAGNPDVHLQPFIEAQPTPALAGGSWKTYQPGKMPRGRLLKVSEAAGLADRGTGGEELYLSGQFVVTASGEGRAVLRAKTGVLSALNPLEHSGSIRVVVEFPAGLQPPAEGSTISRDEMRPFEIQNVQRERDGTVDVMVREVTTPQ